MKIYATGSTIWKNARDLQRIGAQVDWDEELGAITREVSSQFGPALLFENIRDHKNTLCRRLFTNGTGTRERVCRFIGIPEATSYRDMVPIFKERFSRPVKPVTVGKGPVKENIVRGAAVNLEQFPVPKWNPLDGGRYIMTSATVVTRDPDTGLLNGGTYRGMITGKNTIGVLLAMTQGWGKHFSKYKNRGQEMPVAVVIGWDQTLFLAASTPVNYPEYEMAGSLRGAPVELVQCELSDLSGAGQRRDRARRIRFARPQHFYVGRTVQRISWLLRWQQIAETYHSC